MKTEIWGKGHVKTEAATGVMEIQARDAEDCQRPPGAGGSRKGSSLQPSERKYGPANSLISDVWPPGLGESKFLMCADPQSVVLCYGHPRKRSDYELGSGWMHHTECAGGCQEGKDEGQRGLHGRRRLI